MIRRPPRSTQAKTLFPYTTLFRSYPMVVEMCRGSDIGKFTGTYYTFSMAAQVFTPILSGWFLEHVGYWTLFPYAVCFCAAAFVTMTMVRHGDSKPEIAKSRLEAFDVDD